MGDNFLHLARPLAPAAISTQQSTAPVTVTVQPQALFSILDHASRRPAEQERVIGTLLGVRSEDGTEVEIRNCYAVPHTETDEQVEVDMDYQKRMLELHLKASPKEVLLGWYATSSELNTFSALIQNFYGQQGEGTFPHPAVHLTVSTVAGQDVKAETYISAPIGVTAERAADSCLFIPVPHEIKYGDAEKSGLELIAGARDKEDRSQLVQTDIETLERAIEQVLDMLDRVSNYVSNVLEEEVEPSSALGQFLMNTLSLAPKVDAEDIEKDLYVEIHVGCRFEILTLFSQQQPHPRRPPRFIPRQHNSHTNRSLKPTGNSCIDYGSRGRQRGREGWKDGW
jgi:translation initiation factor 3 subunit F